jgi:DNA-directed RNA polymerase subunit RPC12/RpoP
MERKKPTEGRHPFGAYTYKCVNDDCGMTTAAGAPVWECPNCASKLVLMDGPKAFVEQDVDKQMDDIMSGFNRLLERNGRSK